MSVKVEGFKRYFLRKVKNQKLPSGSANASVIRWKWFKSMEFIRETIAQRSTLSNIGSDEISAQCIEVKEEAVDLEEDFSNVRENSETKDTQELPQN